MPLSRPALILTLAFGPGAIWAQAPAQPSPKAIMDQATAELVKSGLAERAIHKGQKAPDFTLPDAHGHPVKLSNLLKKGKVVLTFYRGGWCPFCNRQLESYQAHLAEIHAKGAELVAVSPQTPDATVSTAEKDALTFPVLSDVGNRVARTYGLVFKVPDAVAQIYEHFGVDLAKRNGDTSHELPMPATYIIEQDGTIKLSYVQADYKNRLPVEALLAHL